MSKRKAVPVTTTRPVWTGLALLVLLFLLFLAVYVAAIRATLAAGDGDFNRAWIWPGYLVSAGALVAIGRGWQRLTTPMGLVGFILAGLVWLSAGERLGQDRANVAAAMTLLAFVGGSVVMRRERGVRVAMLHRRRVVVLQSLGLGLRVGLPLAVMGGGYLYLTGVVTAPGPELVNSAWQAIQPAIVGEVVFRFFVLNTCLALLAHRPARLPLITGIFLLAIVPYSLVQMPGLWVSQPLGAIALLILSSLLFGLPATYLQWRQTLEAAVSFQWVVDAVRLWAGLLPW